MAKAIPPASPNHSQRGNERMLSNTRIRPNENYTKVRN
jgi:hypothetical protein